MGNRKHQQRSRESVSDFEGNIANPELAHWMHQLRSSSAASRHTTKARKGTRRSRERLAIRDQF
jgi:hypothetical protein